MQGIPRAMGCADETRMNKLGSPLTVAAAILFLMTASVGFSAEKTAPASTTAPVLIGLAIEGQTLTASTATWSRHGPTTYEYQWQRCATATSCVTISNATTGAYRLATVDVGTQIRVFVTATNHYGSVAATSALTSTVAPAPLSETPIAPTDTLLPSVTGTAQAGQTLTASTGSWSGTAPLTYAYQWYYCDSTGTTCAPIVGYTGSTYAPVSDDVGGRDKVRVTATNAAGSSAAFSAMTPVIVAAAEVSATSAVAPSSTTTPSISGSVTQGQTLTVSAGNWSGTTPMTYGYQWSRCTSSCSTIGGATASQYTLTSSDVGASVLATVSAANSAGTASAQSGQSASVAPSTSSAPPSGAWFSANFEGNTLAPWDKIELGTGSLLVSSYPTGGTTPGIVRPTTAAAASGSYSAELTVTPTAHASPAASTDSVFLWNEFKSYMGHNGQETWEAWKVRFPSPGFNPNAACGGGCPWFTEHHNDGSFLPFYNAGQVTWEYPNLVWGVITDHTVSDGTVKPQIFMRVWGGDDNTPSQPNKSPEKYVFTRQSLQTNHWYVFKSHVVWSPDATVGYVQWWLDGQLFYSSHTPTLWRHPDGSVSTANFEIGNYRPHDTTTSTIYFDDFLLGPTEASVGG
jgi:hypothetical protein